MSINKRNNIRITETITERDEESVVHYFNEIRKYQPMDAEEEVKLAIKMKAGDERAYSEFVNRNLRFVVSIAKKYLHLGIPFADLIAEGNIGLVRAVERFDPELGYKFSSFAVHYIRQAILDAITSHSDTVRLPSNCRHKLNQLNRILSDYEKENGHRPDDEELADLANITVEKLSLLENLGKRTTSLDTPMPGCDDFYLIDTLHNDEHPTDETSDKESLRMDIRSVLATLPERESRIISMCFGLEENRYAYSLGEIATRMGISQERTRQLKERALKALRSNQQALILLKKYAA